MHCSQAFPDGRVPHTNRMVGLGPAIHVFCQSQGENPRTTGKAIIAGDDRSGSL